jgi:hypothetical protein
LDFLKTAVDGIRHGARFNDFKISDLKRQFNGAESRRFYSLLGPQFPRGRIANAANVSSTMKSNGGLVREPTSASRHSRRTFWRRRKANVHIGRRNQRH